MLRRFLFCGAGVLALFCVTGIPGPLQAQHARGGFHSGRPTNFGRPNRGLDRRVFDARFGRPNGGFDRRFSGFDRDFDRRFFDPRSGAFRPGFLGFNPELLGFPSVGGFSPGFGGF